MRRASLPREPAGAPAPASLGADSADRAVTPEDLGIAVAGSVSGQLALGRWYPVANLPGIYLSVIQPEAIAKEILDSYPNKVSHLDAVEASALDYLIAFDLGAYDLGFILGTDHPRVDWSPRPPDAVRDDRLPGPDGIGTPAPLITTGMVSPKLVGRTVAAFTGGFKREHGAFRYGDLADRNHGSHYGFIEAGVVFSKLQPGLATLYRLDDGTVHMGTWSEADDRLLARIEFARQNGVPLIEPDPATGAPAPGPLVARWGRRQLVRLGRGEASHAPRRRLPSGWRRAAASWSMAGFRPPRPRPWRASFRPTAVATRCSSTSTPSSTPTWPFTCAKATRSSSSTWSTAWRRSTRPPRAR